MVKKRFLKAPKLEKSAFLLEREEGKIWKGVSKIHVFESFFRLRPVVFGKEEVENLPQKRLIFLAFVFGIFFLAILSRLFYLQIIKGTHFKTAAEENRVQILPIHAPRGAIFDCCGQILARSSPGFRLVKKDKVKQIFYDQAINLEKQGLVKEGVEGPMGRLEVDLIREYNFGPVLAHVLGYTGEITAEELGKDDFATYLPGDRIGRTGLEKAFEEFVRGKRGGNLIEVDAKGDIVKFIGKKETEAGHGLRLTLDFNLQKKVYEELEKGLKKVNGLGAAAVAQNPKTGEILALVSLPSFDGNIFTTSSSQEALEKLLTDENQPLFNRAIQGTYPTGSIFKIVTSLAGLESGKINKDTKFEDTGVLYLGPFSFPNWYFTQYGKKEGILDLVGAIRRSNDIYFYQVGRLVGEETLAHWANNLGMGKPLEIDLPGEAEGLVPTPRWKEEVKNQIWFPGDTLHMAIGQGDVLATPLQVVDLTSFVANGGTLYKPFIVSAILDEKGNLVAQVGPKKIAENLVKKENLDLVREGMKQACQQAGTGWPFFNFKVTVACKTGTAEYGDPRNRTHAWFTVFAPYDDPKIALTVLIEAGGEGSNAAAPVAKEILDWYFSR